MTALEFGSAINNITISMKPFALKLTKDMEQANDLIQETVLKALSNREKFSDGTNLKAWLFTIMRNSFFTNYQRMVRRKTFIDTTENLHFINSTESIAQNSAYGSFAMADITKQIDKLGEAYKDPFLMHYNGFKYQEIAEKLEIPIGTVKNRIHIARRDLKDALQVYA